jgi:hypothetical protein
VKQTPYCEFYCKCSCGLEKQARGEEGETKEKNKRKAGNPKEENPGRVFRGKRLLQTAKAAGVKGSSKEAIL